MARARPRTGPEDPEGDDEADDVRQVGVVEVEPIVQDGVGRDVVDPLPVQGARPPHEAVITGKGGLLILFHGMLVATVAALGFWIIYQGDESQVARARTVTVCVTAFSQLFFAIGCRSQRFTMPELGLFTNPHLLGAIVISGLLQLSVVTLPFAQPLFEVATHLSWEWLLVLGLSLTPVTIVEIVKLVQGSGDLK